MARLRLGVALLLPSRGIVPFVAVAAAVYLLPPATIMIAVAALSHRVASRLRGQGLGGRMMAWALEEARRHGCASIELLTHASRTDAHRFYERHGFIPSHVGFKRALDPISGDA